MAELARRDASDEPATAPGGVRPPAPGMALLTPRALSALTCVALALIWAWHWPVGVVPLMVLLGGCAAAVAWRPVLALALLPSALPIVDLAPWTGRIYSDEFGLLVLVCVAVGYWRTPPAPRARIDTVTLAFGALGTSFALSTVRALLPWPGIDANSFSSYLSPFNAVRIAQGGLWAWATIWLYRRLVFAGPQRERLFALGMGVGLALTCAFVVWERVAFAHLLDFAGDFRVSGPISAMHKGGAYIECYLAVAASFAAAAALGARSLAARAAAAALLLAATYALAVTFSRNGYAALVAALGVVLLGALRGATSVRRAVAAGGLALLVALVAVPIIGGPFARVRIAGTIPDFAVRSAHWEDALAQRDGGWLTTLLGMGVGRFPDSHFWRSREPRHAASMHLEREDGRAFLRLGAGSTLYVEQIVRPEPGRDLVLRARLRASRDGAALAVALCEKWLLTSSRCASGALHAGPRAQRWHEAELRLSAPAAANDPVWRPQTLALQTPSPGLRIDVTDLRLESTAGQNLLSNGNFEAGMDRWFFTTDVDPPWHIHSLPVAVLFDQGWLGVLAWAAVLGIALARGAALAWRGGAMAAAAPAALLAFLVSGSLNTLIDAPRFLWLLLVLAWFCARAPVASYRRLTLNHDRAPT